MTTADIKVKLHEEIEHSDSKLLKMIYALVREYHDSDDTLMDKRKLLIREERERYLRGEGKSYSWEEVKKMATGKRPNEL